VGKALGNQRRDLALTPRQPRSTILRTVHNAPMDLRHIRHQKTGTENRYPGGVLTAGWFDPARLSLLLAAIGPLVPKEEVSQMEVRHRAQQAPIRAIVLALALMSAVVVALAVLGVRLSMPAHSENSTVPAPTQVVGS